MEARTHAGYWLGGCLPRGTLDDEVFACGGRWQVQVADGKRYLGTYFREVAGSPKNQVPDKWTRARRVSRNLVEPRNTRDETCTRIHSMRNGPSGRTNSRVYSSGDGDSVSDVHVTIGHGMRLAPRLGCTKENRDRSDVQE